MTNRDLIQKLQTLDPDAQIEFEVPKENTEVEPGDRILVQSARETSYSQPTNKWVVLS